LTKVEGLVTRRDGRAGTGTVEVHNVSGDIVDQIRIADGGSFIYYLSPGVWTFFTYDAEGHRGNAQVALDEGDTAVHVDLEIK